MFVLSSMAAQGPGRGRLTPEERTSELKKELNLTDKQTEKVKAIYEDQEKELRKLFESGPGDREAMREVMQQKNQETDKKILALLNAQQKTRYSELITQRQKRFEQRRQNRN